MLAGVEASLWTCQPRVIAFVDQALHVIVFFILHHVDCKPAVSIIPRFAMRAKKWRGGLTVELRV